MTADVRTAQPRPGIRVYDPICSIEGCGRPSCSRGWCNTHYSRWRRNGDPLIVRPSPPPPPPRRGPIKPRVPCQVGDCDRTAVTRGWCVKHYHRWRRNGHPTTPKQHQPRTPRTHCKRRHRLTSDNVYVYSRKDGSTVRICRACDAIRVKAYQARKRLQAAIAAEEARS